MGWESLVLISRQAGAAREIFTCPNATPFRTSFATQPLEPRIFSTQEFYSKTQVSPVLQCLAAICTGWTSDHPLLAVGTLTHLRIVFGYPIIILYMDIQKCQVRFP